MAFRRQTGLKLLASEIGVLSTVVSRAPAEYAKVSVPCLDRREQTLSEAGLRSLAELVIRQGMEPPDNRVATVPPYLIVGEFVGCGSCGRRRELFKT